MRLFPYFGSKIRMAKLYPEPEYDTIVEPFAGAAGYSCRYHDRQVILCDKNPLVCEIIQYLIDATPEQILALPLVLPWGLKEFDGDLSRVERRLIGLWMQPCGYSGNIEAAEQAEPSGWYWHPEYSGDAGLWGDSCRKRLAQVVKRIKHWQVHCCSYENIVGGPVTWFIDPPYQHYGSEYEMSRVDYPHLAQWCRRLPGQVIVCEAAPADWLPFEHLSYQQGNTKEYRKELMWRNV